MQRDINALQSSLRCVSFFFNDTATTEIYTLSLHDALPILRRISACSGLRTILTRPMPSLRQILLSICPRLEAAAVCTRALWPSRRIVSVMPSAVSGLTKQEAPSAGVIPAGSGRHSVTLRQRYCAYIAPPIIATVFPISAFAASDDP